MPNDTAVENIPPWPPSAPAKPMLPALITSWNMLSTIALAPQDVTFLLNGELIRLQVRGLNGVEASEIDAGIPEPIPPKVPKASGPGAPKSAATGEEFDYKDAAYQAARRKYNALIRAKTLSLGLVGLEIPGSTLDEKADWLANNLPPRLPNALQDKIRELTAGTIELANFTSAAGSTPSQS